MTAVFLAVVVASVDAGFRFRRWTWDQTVSLRYVPDMNNAWRWGSRAAKEGYFALYDRVVAESPNRQYGLDYVPLRLAVMTLWARWAQAEFPNVGGWQNTYAFNAPLLRFNAAMELAAAVGIFFLTRHWIRKEHTGPAPARWMAWIRRRLGRRVSDSSMAAPEAFSSPRFFEGNWIALVAAALVWFNASSVFSAHARPTWDVWVIPFYVWAAFFASRNNWFTAGVIVGVGAMFKGQQLIVAPFFLLWPLFLLRFGAVGRFVMGVALAAGLVVSPWQVWLTPRWGPVMLCIAAALIGPAMWAAVRFIPRTRRFAKVRPAMWLTGACLAVAIWASPRLFNTSTAWCDIGFIYGIDKMPALESGGAASIAALLQHRFGWQSDTPTVFPFTTYAMTMKTVLLIIGYGLMALCAAAAAWHAARHDRRFLLAVAAPWLVYFTVFPQMHERYLLWASLMTASAVACGVGVGGLHLLITAFSWIMGMNQILGSGRREEFAKGISPTFGRSLYQFTSRSIPDSGWAIAVICLIWLWLMFAYPRRRHPIKGARLGDGLASSEGV